jgi:hypothetical protein
MKRAAGPTKKDLILEIGESLGAKRFTPAELEQVKRQLIVRLGSLEGRTSPDYIASVLQQAGKRVLLSTRADTEDRYEEEFEDLLHFATLEEAEVCLIRLDELLRKFRAEGERAAAERVQEVARLGRRRAEMIARNPRVEPQKRAEKQEMVRWFALWLETPDVFFDWLEVRKQSPEYRELFGSGQGHPDE